MWRDGKFKASEIQNIFSHFSMRANHTMCSLACQRFSRLTDKVVYSKLIEQCFTVTKHCEKIGGLN